MYTLQNILTQQIYLLSKNNATNIFYELNISDQVYILNQYYISSLSKKRIHKRQKNIK